MTNSRRIFRDLPKIFADVLVIFAGVWSLSLVTCVYLKVSFNQFLAWAWLPLIISVALCIFFLREYLSTDQDTQAAITKAPGSPAPTLLTPLILLIVTCLIGVEWYVLHFSYWIFWAAAIIYLLSLFQATRSYSLVVDKPHTAMTGWPDAVMLIALVCLAVFITLIINHPDPDDAFYVNMLVSTLDHPALPMLSFDGMHGDVHAPLIEVFYKPQTISILQAVIAKTTGISAEAIYYIVSPAFFAAFVVIALWLFVRSLDSGAAWLGLLIGFLIMLAWGESHRAYGNFSLVRLYQGKGVLLFFFTPLIIYYARLFAFSPSWRNWLLLMFAQIGAVAFSSSALITVSITAGIAILSSASLSRQGVARVLKGWLASTPLIVILILIFLEKLVFVNGSPINTSGISNEVLQYTKMLDRGVRAPKEVYDFTTMFGTGWRAPIALLAILSLPLVAHAAKLASAAWITRYVLLTYLLILNGITGPFLAEHVTNNFSWRLYWAIPAPAIVAAALSFGFVLAIRIWRNNSKPALGMLILTISAATFITFLAAGKWSVSPGRDVAYQWATPKAHVLPYKIAQYVVKNTPSGSMALVAYPISRYVTRFHNAPGLIAVRRTYMGSFRRYWGRNELRQRQLLAGYVSGDIGNADNVREITPWVLSQIDKRDIKCIVTFTKLSNYPPLHRGLINMGFMPRQAAAYVIWLRP